MLIKFWFCHIAEHHQPMQCGRQSPIAHHGQFKQNWNCDKSNLRLEFPKTPHCSQHHLKNDQSFLILFIPSPRSTPFHVYHFKSFDSSKRFSTPKTNGFLNVSYWDESIHTYINIYICQIHWTIWGSTIHDSPALVSYARDADLQQGRSATQCRLQRRQWCQSGPQNSTGQRLNKNLPVIYLLYGLCAWLWKYGVIIPFLWGYELTYHRYKPGNVCGHDFRPGKGGSNQDHHFAATHYPLVN